MRFHVKAKRNNFIALRLSETMAKITESKYRIAKVYKMWQEDYIIGPENGKSS